MLKSKYTQTGSRIVLILGQFIALALCVTYIAYMYIEEILPDRLVKAYFKQGECFIISKKLNSHGELAHLYRADFLVSYNAGGAQYNRWVYGNGLDTAFSANESEQEDTLGLFDVGGTYTCWYNPEDPTKVVLVVRHDWMSIYPIILPAVFSLFIFYYFIKNLFILSGAIAIKPVVAEKRKKKRK